MRPVRNGEHLHAAGPHLWVPLFPAGRIWLPSGTRKQSPYGRHAPDRLGRLEGLPKWVWPPCFKSFGLSAVSLEVQLKNDKPSAFFSHCSKSFHVKSHTAQNQMNSFCSFKRTFSRFCSSRRRAGLSSFLLKPNRFTVLRPPFHSCRRSSVLTTVTMGPTCCSWVCTLERERQASTRSSYTDGS